MNEYDQLVYSNRTHNNNTRTNSYNTHHLEQLYLTANYHHFSIVD